LVYLIVQGTTDICQGPLRGAFLDHAQDVTPLAVSVNCFAI
jgi:hypothetical protein